jgi:uncharacterized protein (TIGR02118 family)
MASLIVLYTRPDDVEGFEAHYRETHIPIVNALPGIREARVNRIAGTPRGTEAPYHLQAELVFDSMEAMGTALQGEEGMNTSRDAMEMCKRFGSEAEIMLADEL